MEIDVPQTFGMDLNLTIKKKWFDMINIGVKMEEYREIKPYWIKRLMVNDDIQNPIFKKFDKIILANGGHFGNVPKSIFPFSGITIGPGIQEWGAIKDTYYFRIKVSLENNSK